MKLASPIDADNKRNPWWNSNIVFTLLLLTATLISRILLLSEPYFADGPKHVATLARGELFIQAPGYFLFMLSAHLLTKTGLGPGASITVLNIGLDLSGVLVFALLSGRMFPGNLGRLLAICYAFMNAVWFAALIHSSYAAMTLFAPALFYCVVRDARSWFLVACVTWAVGAGLRPSDGVFLLPLLLAASFAYRWPVRITGFALAGTFLLAWWLPTAEHYGGFLAPFAAVRSQQAVESRYMSILQVGITPRSLGNVLRFVSAVVLSLNVLLPLAVLQLLKAGTHRLTRLAILWVAPGSLFFLLWYMSDATYIVVISGGLLLLAGFFCESLSRTKATLWLSAYVAVSMTFMLATRPVEPTNFPRRVLNAYCFKYTGWAIRNHYFLSLSQLEQMNSLKRGR